MTPASILVALAVAVILIAVARVSRLPVFPLAMMALSADRNTPARTGARFNYPVAALKHIYAGSLVVLNATGYAEPGTSAAAKKAVGRACDEVDNSAGGDGDLYIQVDEGVFRFDNSAGVDEITLAEVGSACYVADDATVAKTTAGGLSVAGYVRDVDSDGVWVEIKNIHSADGDLVAANNLSDVAAAATARANLGANKVVLSLRATDLAGANAVLYGIVSPVAGTITKIHSVLKGHALATGDATLTGKIGGVAITDGAITITQAGSAIGDKDSVTPSAANVVAAGDEIQFLVGGTNDNAAAFAEISLLIET